MPPRGAMAQLAPPSDGTPGPLQRRRTALLSLRGGRAALSLPGVCCAATPWGTLRGCTRGSGAPLLKGGMVCCRCGEGECFAIAPRGVLRHRPGRRAALSLRGYSAPSLWGACYADVFVVPGGELPHRFGGRAAPGACYAGAVHHRSGGAMRCRSEGCAAPSIPVGCHIMSSLQGALCHQSGRVTHAPPPPVRWRCTPPGAMGASESKKVI